MEGGVSSLTATTGIVGIPKLIEFAQAEYLARNLYVKIRTRTTTEK